MVLDIVSTLDRLILAEPLVVLLGGMLVTIVPILADRSRHRPGNLAPVQLISAIGAWALVILNAAMLVVSSQDGSPIVACASLATLSTALFLFLRGDGGKVESGQAPETIDAMIGEIRQILEGTRRTGIEKVTAVVVSGNTPFLSVSVSGRGHVVVRARQDLKRWLERHRGPGGAGSYAVESLLRFTFLHELGHILNGDHLTYRFGRSVLVAHLWWMTAAAVGLVLLPWDVPAAHTALLTSLCLAPPFIAQSLLARRFIAEREEVADQRAMQTLHPSDASLLMTPKRRRTGRPSPTILEQLMTDLLVQTPVERRTVPLLSNAIRWIWPEGGNIRNRCALLALGRAERRGEPIRWAASIGVQCGLLSISLLAAAFAAFGSSPLWTSGFAFGLAFVTMTLICSMAATYCGMRIDPAFVRLHDLRRATARRTAGAVFYLSFSISALLLYLFVALSMSHVVLSYRLFALSVALSAVQVVIGSFMAAARVEGGPEGAARALRYTVLRAGPAILISLAVIICSSIVAAWCFGLGPVQSGMWKGLAMVTFAGATTSIVASRSTNAAVRAIPPIAILASPGNVYVIRIFWRELYFDRASMPDTRIGLIGGSTYAGIALSFACGAAYAARVISRVATEEIVFQNMLLMTAILVGFLVVIPKRVGATTHLLELEHLQMFDSLLTALQTARLPVEKLDNLKRALAVWLRSEAALPRAVLPDPRAIWRLEALLPLIRVARAVGEEETLTRWRPAIIDSLRHVVTHGAVTVNGSRPSLGYSVLAAQVVEEAQLAPEIPIEPMLDSIAHQLEEWLGGKGASAEAVASACSLLAAHGLSWPGADRMRMRSIIAVEFLLTRPIIRHSLRELVAYTALLENTAVRDRLENVVRSRMWETLVLNPDIDISLLLDCYLAAVSMGETDETRLANAEVKIGEIAERMADGLTKICREAVP
jgi:Zn-dependent protease with chaperone function